jgi:hypothetical protein
MIGRCASVGLSSLWSLPPSAAAGTWSSSDRDRRSVDGLEQHLEHHRHRRIRHVPDPRAERQRALQLTRPRVRGPGVLRRDRDLHGRRLARHLGPLRAAMPPVPRDHVRLRGQLGVRGDQRRRPCGRPPLRAEPVRRPAAELHLRGLPVRRSGVRPGERRDGRVQLARAVTITTEGARPRRARGRRACRDPSRPIAHADE